MSKVLVEQDGQVTVISICRPDRRNAVDAETAALLRLAFETFEADDNSRVAILTGIGESFCAGYDLHSVAASHPDHDADGPGPMGPTRMLLSKPVIAAVEGHAVAGGLELALWCDLRVASTTAIFGVFCRRWGVPLIDGGTVRLPRIVGQGRALDMILTGRPVDAAEAMSIGLADRLAEPGDALSDALSLARSIASFPQLCMRADRKSSYTQWDSDIAEALRSEAAGGEAPLRKEGLPGAARFAGGEGRAGQFDQ